MAIDKVSYSVSHAQERALERYGLDFSEYDIFSIVDMIQSGESKQVKFLRRQSNYRTLWKIKYLDNNLYVVYNSRHKVVATFLTKYMINNPKRREKI